MAMEKFALLSGYNDDTWIVVAVYVGLQTYWNSALCCYHVQVFLVMSCLVMLYNDFVSIETV
jgi:hypothetical protein